MSDLYIHFVKTRTSTENYLPHGTNATHQSMNYIFKSAYVVELRLMGIEIVDIARHH
jgi:hypothetical protein